MERQIFFQGPLIDPGVGIVITEGAGVVLAEYFGIGGSAEEDAVGKAPREVRAAD